LVGTHDPSFIVTWRNHCFWRWQCGGSVYLYLVLVAIQTQNPYKVILTLVVVLLLIYLIKGGIGFLYASFIIGVIALLSADIATFMVKGWMKLAHILSFIFPPILLGLIYVLFLTPIAFLSRLWRKESSIALKNSSSTQFKEVNKVFDTNTFEKMW
jgi:hypothetical protein